MKICIKKSIAFFSNCLIQPQKQYFSVKKLNDLRLKTDQDKIHYSMEDPKFKENSIKYSFLIEHHHNLKAPYMEHELYKELFELTRSLAYEYYIKTDIYLEGLYILEKYLNLNTAFISNDFFVELIEEFSRVQFSSHDLWYFAEKHAILMIETFDKSQLSNLIYSFGFAQKGSNYLWKVFSQRILKIEPKNLSENDFILVYNGFKLNNIPDKLLWAFLKATNLEVFPNIMKEENIEDFKQNENESKQV